MTTALAVAALAVAVTALAIALMVMRQNADTVTELRNHRRAHARTEGHADPDRRHRDDGPPGGQPDRRTPDRGRHERPDPPTTTLHPPDPQLIDRVRGVDPHPVAAFDTRTAAPDAATGELEAPDLPTAMLAAQRPDVPPPAR